jgi:hypothetical protein
MYRGVRAATIAAAVVALAVPASPAAAAPSLPRSCPWFLEPTFDRENILFPEVTTTYLGALAPVPPGGYVEITGEFPHARYMSLQTYSSGLRSLTVLRDEVIVPDPGSANPFVAGAYRTVTARKYTVRIVSGQPPENGGPPNTLYDTNADGSESGRGLAYRIYLPDTGTGKFAGVAPPKLTFVLKNGKRIPAPDCPDLVPDTSPIWKVAANLGLGIKVPTPSLLAYREPVFHKYVNAPTSYALGLTDNQYLGRFSPAVTSVTLKLPAGLGENADNKYVAAYLSQEFGTVLALRAKLPTAPRTLAGQPTMGTGQLRFWSMCTGNRTTITHGCVVDEDTPVDANGRYTVVISQARARPRNATKACGAAWIPWGPDPKGIAIMRNMLPADGFANAVQRATPGTEEAVLGPYYPRGTYYSKAAFEAIGCPI